MGSAAYRSRHTLQSRLRAARTVRVAIRPPEDTPTSTTRTRAPCGSLGASRGALPPEAGVFLCGLERSPVMRLCSLRSHAQVPPASPARW